MAKLTLKTFNILRFKINSNNNNNKKKNKEGEEGKEKKEEKHQNSFLDPSHWQFLFPEYNLSENSVLYHSTCVSLLKTKDVLLHTAYSMIFGNSVSCLRSHF